MSDNTALTVNTTSPTPWKAVEAPRDGEGTVLDANGTIVASSCGYCQDALSLPDAQRIVACVNAWEGVPSSALNDPNLKTLLHTLVQYAIADDAIGQRETGWVIAQLLKRHLTSSGL